MDILKGIGKALGFVIDAFVVIVYHVFLFGIGAVGVFLAPSGIGFVVIAVAVGLAILYWTTGWMIFLG
ncbi:hypothetical protein DFR70_102349 [Nocardia tenerifensis]|uniref:Uncharacterized protein n=1 Tax=Nocardia tenerifensis TaxID=228006 RepID=A0A318K6G8_9NOCA|nr:hypothetical protein [Nocardia tenerifensis]PXX68665.1 hypothetical protein DFR70_102349 [Nocardia tenerifensis]